MAQNEEYEKYRTQILDNNKRFEKNLFFVDDRVMSPQQEVRYHMFKEEDVPGPHDFYKSTKILSIGSPVRPASGKRFMDN